MFRTPAYIAVIPKEALLRFRATFENALRCMNVLCGEAAVQHRGRKRAAANGMCRLLPNRWVILNWDQPCNKEK